MSEGQKFVFYVTAIIVFVYALFQATDSKAYEIHNARLLVFDKVTLERGFTARSFDDQLQIAIGPKLYKSMTVKIEELGQGTELPKNKESVTIAYHYTLKTDKVVKPVPLIFQLKAVSSKYTISFYNETTKTWRDLPTTVDVKKKTLKTTITELSGEVVVTQVNPSYKETEADLSKNLTAASAVVYDEDTNEVLFEKNPDEVRPIASLTKLMTVLVFLDNNPGWNNRVTVSDKDKVGGAALPIVAGDVVTVENLFNATLIGSKNDATRALMRSTGIKEAEFVKLMNDKARELGLTNTKYVEPTGLDERNVSTANDLLILSKIVFADPKVFTACATKNYKFTYKHKGANWSIVIPNTNKLVNRDLNVTGGKTGYTTEAGYNLITQASQLKGDDHELIALVLGAKISQNYEEVYKLLKYYF